MKCLLGLVFVSIVSIGTAQDCGNEKVLLSNVKFTLFLSQNKGKGVELNENNSKKMNTKVVTTVIIHGFAQHLIKPWVPRMKDAYLQQKSLANVITVDWTAYTTEDNRTNAICATRQGVGRYVGDMIYNLTKIGVDVGKVQMNGFGMGAHVAGIAGQRVFELTISKVCRINGLAAAKKGFFDQPAEQRLDASDAKFVQAIHTNNGVGLADHYGIIDFEVNYNSLNRTCGSSQPGCPEDPGIPNLGASAKPFCNKLRAAAYYIKSINSNKFVGVECPDDSCSNFGNGKCSSGKKTVMGEMCPKDQKGVRFLNTNSKAPFAQG